MLGAFSRNSVETDTAYNTVALGDREDYYQHFINFDASFVVPTSSENKPYTVSTLILIVY